MHVDKCPRCGKPGALVRDFRQCGKPNCHCAGPHGARHGPYPVVQHYVASNRPVKRCHISMKMLVGDEGERIRKLLAKEKHGKL